MNPLTIDVVIPAYNAANFIRATLDSVVQQTLLPAQIIVVDDGSTDNTRALVTEYAKTATVPIVIVEKENGGLSSARNAGIKKSTATYIAFLDADDLWEKDKLTQQVQVFTSSTFTNLGLVYCDYDIIDTKGNKDHHSYKTPIDRLVRGHAFTNLVVANKVLSSGSGVLIKKETFDTVGMFDETLRYGEDWDMWLRIADTYEIDYADKVLVRIRRHKHSMTANSNAVFAGEIAFYKKWIPLLQKNNRTIPLRWRAKVLFRIITRLPRTALIKDALPILFVPFG